MYLHFDKEPKWEKETWKNFLNHADEGIKDSFEMRF